MVNNYHVRIAKVLSAGLGSAGISYVISAAASASGFLDTCTCAGRRPELKSAEFCDANVTIIEIISHLCLKPLNKRCSYWRRDPRALPAHSMAGAHASSTRQILPSMIARAPPHPAARFHKPYAGSPGISVRTSMCWPTCVSHAWVVAHGTRNRQCKHKVQSFTMCIDMDGNMIIR